ncbi:hypothetical protein GCM10027176_52330 [Actinoallomurus bryophytorum]|uniref:hypothetical protein n=1 Tax=Actinoallomurus bryophytorum TaxID=1490222 RepID=UPI00114FA57F|nr:hypothetical protein [Actinoallomurus bryophytorum]
MVSITVMGAAIETAEEPRNAGTHSIAPSAGSTAHTHYTCARPSPSTRPLQHPPVLERALPDRTDAYIKVIHETGLAASSTKTARSHETSPYSRRVESDVHPRYGG